MLPLSKGQTDDLLGVIDPDSMLLVDNIDDGGDLDLYYNSTQSLDGDMANTSLSLSTSFFNMYDGQSTSSNSIDIPTQNNGIKAENGHFPIPTTYPELHAPPQYIGLSLTPPSSESLAFGSSVQCGPLPVDAKKRCDFLDNCPCKACLNSSPTALELSLSEIEANTATLKNELASLVSMQKELKPITPPASAKPLYLMHTRLWKAVTAARSQLQDLHSHYLLTAHHLHLVRTLGAALKMAYFHLLLLRLELRHIILSRPGLDGCAKPSCFASLVVSMDPFFQTVKQQRVKSKTLKKTTCNQIEVALLLGAQSMYRPVGKSMEVIGEKVQDGEAPTTPPPGKGRKRIHSASTNDSDALMNAVSPLKDGRAAFNELRFLHGTGGKPALLRFAMKLEVPDEARSEGADSVVWCQRELKSNMTKPFIVLCNESRWDAGAGKLMKMDMFADTALPPSLGRLAQNRETPPPMKVKMEREADNLPPCLDACATLAELFHDVISNLPAHDARTGTLSDDFFPPLTQEVSWCTFANVLHTHYLQALRQSPSKPQRAMVTDELSFIHRHRFNSKGTITVADCDEFWSWFGPVLHPIRHSKQLSTLYTRGFIYGLVSKSGAERLLLSMAPNTFLVRFSEQRAGRLAIASSIVDAEGRKSVKHYMLDHNNAHGKDSTRPHPYLVEVIRDNPTLHFVLQRDGMKSVCVSRNAMLGNYTAVSRTHADTMALPNGYEDEDNLSKLTSNININNTPTSPPGPEVATPGRTPPEESFASSPPAPGSTPSGDGGDKELRLRQAVAEFISTLPDDMKTAEQFKHLQHILNHTP